jgi:hypothetical protein
MDGRASLKDDVSLQCFKSMDAVRANIPWSRGLDATHDGAHRHPVTIIKGKYPQRMCQPCGQISSSELGYVGGRMDLKQDCHSQATLDSL